MTIARVVLYLACAALASPGALRAQPPAQEPGGVPDASLRTRHASFAPASFADLPGWDDDRLDGVLPALRQSCRALRTRNGTRDAWEAPCRHAAGLAAADGAGLRAFFEQDFRLYQIRAPDGNPNGTITGYYEAEINGSRTYGGPFVHPVHAVPGDLLYLDARALGGGTGEGLRVRIEGRNVVPLSAPAGADGAGYSLDLGGVRPDIRTRRYRVRLDGTRVVPYYSRREIERGRMTQAPVIAWVDDPAALYSMQIQGAGRVHLRDGSVLRLAYGEQNGHPFLPSLGALPHWLNAEGRRRVVATRGLGMLADGEDDAAAPGAAEAEPALRAGAHGPASAADAELEAMIAALMPGAQPRPAPPPAPPPPPAAPAAAPAPQGGPAPSLPAAPGTPNSDPSYVFFRPVPDDGDGPPGALGVPLTPGRSVAVDPRTTPLGTPVFISTGESGSKAGLNRLMLAQDTGGAIRGAVRADYFWGLGAAAFARASRMNAEGRMWVLLPAGQKLAGHAGAVLLRGAAGGATEAECLVPDPELCVE
jgi:membrane-bound lytic murein transglycosylase A